MSEIDSIGISRLLPHRYPFLLVDRVESIDPGKKIIAYKNVTSNEPFFTGHFPGMPVMPGVLIVEALAQTSGLMIFNELGIDKFDENSDMFFLAGINEARFKRQVVPGDKLLLEVELVKHRLNLWKFRGVASVDGEVACTAEFMNAKES